jgi:hypothetical protein
MIEGKMMKRLYAMVVMMCMVVGQIKAIEIPYEEHNYRRAQCDDVLVLLEMTNAIERSNDSQVTIEVYPYVLRAPFLHTSIKREALFVATNGDDQIDAVVRLFLLDPAEVAALMDATSLKDWRTKYQTHDVFLYSDYWFTEWLVRNRGTWTKLFAYALQMSTDKIVAHMRAYNSKHVYLLVRMVENPSNRALIQQLIATAQDWFADVMTALPQQYNLNVTLPMMFGMTTTETTKPVYDLEASDLKVIATMPATLYMLVAHV